MRKLAIAISVMLLFSACSKDAAQVTAKRKGHLLSEQIIDNSRCSTFKTRLSSSVIADAGVDAIDEIYREAVNTSCINKDI